MHFQRMRDHMGQARDVVLEQIVADALAHHIHGGRLADGAGQQHEGRMPGLAANQLPGIQRREAGQVVVGQDEVECLVVQRSCGIIERVDHDNLADQPAAQQAQPRQRLVGGGILDVQYAQGLVRWSGIPGGAIMRYILEHKCKWSCTPRDARHSRERLTRVGRAARHGARWAETLVVE